MTQKYTSYRCDAYEMHGHQPITHVYLMRSDELGLDLTQESKTPRRLGEKLKIDSVQLLCDECVFSMNLSQNDEDRMVIPIETFLRNAKTDSN